MEQYDVEQYNAERYNAEQYELITQPEDNNICLWWDISQQQSFFIEVLIVFMICSLSIHIMSFFPEEMGIFSMFINDLYCIRVDEEMESIVNEDEEEEEDEDEEEEEDEEGGGGGRGGGGGGGVGGGGGGGGGGEEEEEGEAEG